MIFHHSVFEDLRVFLRFVSGDFLGSITSRCSGKEPALLPRTLLREGRPDTRERRKSSLVIFQLSHTVFGLRVIFRRSIFQDFGFFPPSFHRSIIPSLPISVFRVAQRAPLLHQTRYHRTCIDYCNSICSLCSI